MPNTSSQTPQAKHLKPNTGFDLFMQNSNLLADGTPD